MTLSSPLLAQISGIIHGFGTRAEPIPENLKAQWELRKPQWTQVHGIQCGEVTTQGQLCGEVDALFTRKAGQPIAVVTADCVPILLARRDGGAVAAIHAGWRGTRSRILGELWKRLSASGERPLDWVATIGPAIGPCCYEVSLELAEDFAREFAAYGPATAVPRTRHLNLPAINEAQLREIGLKDIETLNTCTRCSGSAENPLFHSFRREGGGTRQWSAISIRD